MYDHIGLKVNDIGASVRFYEAALKPLGHEAGSRDESSAGLGPADAPALWLYLDKGSAGRGSPVAVTGPRTAAGEPLPRARARSRRRGDSAPRRRTHSHPTY